MHILIADDEQAQRSLLAGYLKKKGYNVTAVASGKEAIEQTRTTGFDLALLDLKMPEIDGIETMLQIKALDPHTYFIILTGYGTVESAVEAMKQGAYDYLSKPVNLDELDMKIARIAEEASLHQELEILKEEMAGFATPDELIAESEKMKEVLNLVARVASSDSTILINGESGTGKEVIARLIHNLSKRKHHRFIAISCAALPETLLESELFGYERGAFSGAEKRKIGKFELADKGTLLLDEIGDLPLNTQVKLLRVLQEFSFERLGSNVPIKVNVRLISATNQNLKAKIREKKFREDLFYRLNVISIKLAPLRERKEDIRPLAEHFIKKFSGKCNKKIEGISKAALNKLMRYNWPGNIRELENIMERAVVLCRKNIIDDSDLPFGEESDILELESLRDMEAHHIRKILEKTDWNITEAAQRLGIHRNTLRLKIKEYDIKKDQ